MAAVGNEDIASITEDGATTSIEDESFVFIGCDEVKFSGCAGRVDLPSQCEKTNNER